MPTVGELIDAYPLTRLQSGMLYHSFADRDAPTYHDISSLRIAGPFDEDALREVLERVIADADILRSGFDLATYSRPMQLVYVRVTAPLTVEDLRGLGPDEQAERVDQWRAREKATPFDPAAAPLLRLHVHRFAEDDFQVNLGFHHAILDGWSLSSLSLAVRS